MKIITQRGNDFIVNVNERIFVIRPSTREAFPVKSVETICKAGYCVEPNPTPEQLKIIEEAVAKINLK